MKRALGNPGKRALPGAPDAQTALEVVPQAAHRRIPACPRTLKAGGRALWKRIWTTGARWLSEGRDWQMVHDVCRKQDLIDRLYEQLDDPAEWTVLNGNGGTSRNPLFVSLKDAEAQKTAWMCLLGMSPSDAARMGLGEVKPATKIDELRARREQRRQDREARRASIDG